MGSGKKASLIVHSGDLDKVMSAFIIGNGFLSVGTPVTLFFTFWGLNALKKNGFRRLPLSRMNLLGLGAAMIRRRMKKSNVASLEVLAKSFKDLGGKIIACDMTIELMGIREKDLRTDLIDDFGTVGKYCMVTTGTDIQLFI